MIQINVKYFTWITFNITLSLFCNEISNCGQCAHNTDCSWCVSNKQCYYTTNIECPANSSEIINSNNIYQCCAISNTCSECTTLSYVECDWCKTNKLCFNTTGNIPIDKCPNWDDVVFKNGTCPNNKQNILKDILSFFKQPYVILISIFIISYIITSSIIFTIVILCEKYKCCQPLTVILLCIQLLLLLPGTPIYIICMLLWRTCMPQIVIDLYTRNHIRSTIFTFITGLISTVCIITALYTYSYGPQNVFYSISASFALLSIIISIVSVKNNNRNYNTCGKLFMFIIKLSIFALLSLVMLFIIIFGIICIFSMIGIYIFNIHKKIDTVHKSYLLQKKEFWILHRFSLSNKYSCLKLKRVNKVNIFQTFFGIILSILYFPITCISALFWGIGQIEKDILTFPITSLVVPAISSLLFWVMLGDIIYTRIIPSYISSSINNIHEFGIEDWIIPLIIMSMNAITLLVTAVLVFRDKRNSLFYNIFYVIPGLFLIGPFLLLLCPWWVRWCLNISWFFSDLLYCNYLRFQNKFVANVINNNNNIAQPLLIEDDEKKEDIPAPIPAPGVPVHIPFFQSNTWKHIRCIAVLLWIPLTIPSILFYPFTYLLHPLLYFGFAAFIAPFCASLIFWLSFTLYMMHYASIDTFISSNIDHNTTSKEINMILHISMLISFIVIIISSLIPLNKKQINLPQNELWQLAVDYKYRLKFPLHFISLWFSSFGVIFGLFIWPFYILKECKYCLITIKQLWIIDKNNAFQSKKIPKPFAFWHIRRYDPSEFNFKLIAMSISFIFTFALAPIFVIGWILTGYTRHIYAFQPIWWFITFILSSLFWFSVIYFICNNIYNIHDNTFRFHNFKQTQFTKYDYIIFAMICLIIILIFIYSIFLTSPRNNRNRKCKYFIQLIALFYSIILFTPYNIIFTYWLSRKALRYYIRCIYSWSLLCTVPCIRSQQEKRQEYLINIQISPITPIHTVFAKVSFELGYDDNRVIQYAQILQKLWYFRAIDMYDISHNIWNQLNLPLVFKESLFELKYKLQKTKSFKQYIETLDLKQYNHIKDLLNVFLTINNLPSTQNDIQSLIQQLDHLCLLNISKLKQYISHKEWNNLKIPKHLKIILHRKFKLKFPHIIQQQQNHEIELQIGDKNNNKHQLGEGQNISMIDRNIVSFDGAAFHEFAPSAPPNNDIPMEISEIKHDKLGEEEIKMNQYDAILSSGARRQGSLNSNDYGSVVLEPNNNNNISTDEYKYDPLELLDPRDTLQDVSTKIAQVLYVDDEDKIWNYLSIFPTHCYCRMYHLSLINNNLFKSLLKERNTPTSVEMELLKSINNIRHRFSNQPKLTFIEPEQTAGRNNKNKPKFEIRNNMTTIDVFNILEYDLGITSQLLYEDCNQLMTHFYSHLFDWFFITKDIWNKLPYFSKCEIVRIRIYDLMKYIEDKYKSENKNNKYLPLLPIEWINEYNTNITIKQYLIGNKYKWKKNVFYLFGVDWNDNTKNQSNAMYQFLDKNMIKKIQLLPNQHRNDIEKWTEFMNANQISQHLRFKINYFALKGQPDSHDVWLNQYINSNFCTK